MFMLNLIISEMNKWDYLRKLLGWEAYSILSKGDPTITATEIYLELCRMDNEFLLRAYRDRFKADFNVHWAVMCN